MSGTVSGAMEWEVRELAADETHALRRAVSADGRTDLPTMRHELDATPGSWHLGAVDATGRLNSATDVFRRRAPLPVRNGARCLATTRQQQPPSTDSSTIQLGQNPRRQLPAQGQEAGGYLHGAGGQYGRLTSLGWRI